MRRKTTVAMIMVGLAAIVSGCDVLDVKPQFAIDADDAFKDKEGIAKGIRGAYSSFGNLSYYGRTFSLFPDLAADILAQPIDGTATDYREVDNNRILPENGGIAGIWGSAYEGINIANNVIAAVPAIPDMTDEEKNAALGELYFIRALNYFNLVNLFGPVPLKIDPTVGVSNLDAPRAPEADVYTRIITDLGFAETHLPDNGPKSAATKNAASALLARAHLYNNNEEQAIVYATKVIESGDYSLPDYAVVFEDDGSAETIFEIDFTNLSRNRIAEYNFPKSLNGRREVEPVADFLDDYENGDDRFAASIAFAGSLPYPIKYDALAIGDDNVIVLRLAEMYLIRAEARARLEIELDEARADLNEVRRRAGLPDANPGTFTNLLTAIERERKVEFAFEGHRWFDLVRTGRAVDVLLNVSHQNQTRFPIPLGEILTNKSSGMTQNPGY